MFQVRDDGVLSYDRQWGWSGAGVFKSDLGGIRDRFGVELDVEREVEERGQGDLGFLVGAIGVV